MPTIFLQKDGYDDYEKLQREVKDATEKFRTLNDKIKEQSDMLTEISELQK